MSHVQRRARAGNGEKGGVAGSRPKRGDRGASPIFRVTVWRQRLLFPAAKVRRAIIFVYGRRLRTRRETHTFLATYIYIYILLILRNALVVRGLQLVRCSATTTTTTVCLLRPVPLVWAQTVPKISARVSRHRYFRRYNTITKNRSRRCSRQNATQRVLPRQCVSIFARIVVCVDDTPATRSKSFVRFPRAREVRGSRARRAPGARF